MNVGSNTLLGGNEYFVSEVDESDRSQQFYAPNYAVLENQEKAYQAISWVYIAVTRLAKSAAMVPFEVVKPKRGTGKTTWEPVFQHKFVKLLDKPNEMMTRLELLEATIGYLYLTGNAYWLLSGRGTQPERIQILRSDRMAIVPDETGRKGLVQGFFY